MPSLLDMRPSPRSVAVDDEEHSSRDCCAAADVATPEIRRRSLDQDEEDMTRHQISSMFRRERSPELRPRDYLGLLSSSSSRRTSANTTMTIDRSCRTKMIRWMHNVVDYCEFDRECAYVATQHLDRFISTSSAAAVAASQNKRTYQLAAVSCLYLAIKTVESQTVLSPEAVSEISDGEYGEAEIVQMEADVLTALGWRVHGPTAAEFASYFLALWDHNKTTQRRDDEGFMDIVRYQIELSTLDYKASLCLPSVVAAAAVCNALDCGSGEADDFLRFVTDLLVDAGCEEDEDDVPVCSQVWSVQDRLVHMLRKAVRGSGERGDSSADVVSSKRTSSKDLSSGPSGKSRSNISANGGESSPVCVSSSHVNNQRLDVGQTRQ